MGYLTEVVLLNDAEHEFRKHPKEFGEAILEGIHKASRQKGQVSVPFFGYCNYISVEKPRHADHHVLFIHSGNCLTAIGEYEQDWEQLCQNHPEYAEKLIKEAKMLLKMAEESLKKSKKPVDNIPKV